MLKAMTKTGLIEKILELTKADPSKYFDKLADHTEEYLNKLLTICEKLYALQSSR